MSVRPVRVFAINSGVTQPKSRGRTAAGKSMANLQHFPQFDMERSDLPGNARPYNEANHRAPHLPWPVSS
jgi:hypothetical protein